MDEATKIWTGIPPQLADRWELIVHEVGKRLKKKRDDIRMSIGHRAYKGLPVDEEELHNRWLSIRHDSEQLVKVIGDNIKKTKDGRSLVPNALVAQILKSEKRAREGGYD